MAEKKYTSRELEEYVTKLMTESEITASKQRERIDQLKKENEKLRAILSGKVLIVEDGSVDTEQLEEDGFYVIPYRQGARPPMWLTHQHEDKGE